MLRRSTGSRFAAGAATTVVAVAAALVLPAPAHAAGRHRAESAYDTTSSKTATATCPDGEVVIGAGGRIKDGSGGVRLAAVIPTQTSVEVRGEELTGHEEDAAWSVIAAAVCEPEGDVLPRIVASQPGSRTAACPDGRVVSGTGFSLPAGALLTGLIPHEEGAGVTVRTSFQLIGGGEPVSYAICLPGNRASWGGIGPRYTRFESTSPIGGEARKSVTVSDWFGTGTLTGVGAEVATVGSASGPISAIGSDVFIDTLMPKADLTGVTIEAARRSSGGSVSTAPTHQRLADASLAGDDGDDWSVTGYGLDHQYY